MISINVSRWRSCAAAVACAFWQFVSAPSPDFPVSGESATPHLESDRAIRCVQAISTGRTEQHLEHCRGTWLPRLWWALTSRSWIEVPILCFAIEHREGLVLFDTGIDPAIKSDPNYDLPSSIASHLSSILFVDHSQSYDNGKSYENYTNSIPKVRHV